MQIVGRDIAVEHGLCQHRSRRAAPHPRHRGRRRSSRHWRSRRLLVSSHRAFALGAGLTESDIANNALATLSGSGQVSPTYWLDYKTGVSHLVNLQTPQAQLTSMSDLETIPIDKGDGDPSGQEAQILGSLSEITPGRAAARGIASRHPAGGRHLRKQCRAGTWAP